MNTGKNWGGNHIENLFPLEAVKRGYLSAADGCASMEWVNEKPDVRRLATIVYVNGEYKGVATKRTKWHEIIEKFNITDKRTDMKHSNRCPEYDIVDNKPGALMIFDNNKGRSITNDAELILADLKNIYPNLKELAIAYRDTCGIWDGLAHNDGVFVGFFPIGETDIDIPKFTEYMNSKGIDFFIICFYKECI